MEAIKKNLDFLEISPYIRLAHYCNNATSKNHQVPRRMIYDYEFIYVCDGMMSIEYTDQIYLVNAQEIHIISPATEHYITIPENFFCNYYTIHFDFIYFGEEHNFSAEEVYRSKCNVKLETVPVDEKLLQRPLYVLDNIELPKKMRINDSVAYTTILDNIIKIHNEKNFAWQIDSKYYMLLLLKQILNDIKLKILDSRKNDGNNFSDITHYIMEHYNETLNFNTICHIYGYSYSNFRKHFKEMAGKTPHEFLTDIRIDRAIELLYMGKYTISEIAHMVGYDDNSYFSRVFKNKKGFSPSNYIK